MSHQFTMTKDETDAVMEQINFFNAQFHACEDQAHLKDFHELMRASKDRCQLMLLKFASPEWVWVKKDVQHPNQEWSIGLVGLPDEAARHIPLHTLQQGLSAELLDFWHIG